MPSRISLRRRCKGVASDEAMGPDAFSSTDSQPLPLNHKIRRKRVALNRSKTVAGNSEPIEDEIQVGVKRSAVEPDALADLTFPPSSPPIKKRRVGRPRKSVGSNDESLMIIINDKPAVENLTAAQAARVRPRPQARSGIDTDKGAEIVKGDSGRPRKPDGQPDPSTSNSGFIRRKSSLRWPTSRESHLSRGADAASYDVPEDDEEEEVSAVRENVHVSFMLSRDSAPEPRGRQGSNHIRDEGPFQHADDNHVQVQEEDQEPEAVPEAEIPSDSGQTSETDEEPPTEVIKLPFGPASFQDHQYVKVYCGSLQRAFLQMGKECWAGGGDGWHSSWKLRVTFDSTNKLAVALKKLYNQLGQVPLHPDIAKQDEYLRQNASRLQLQVSAVNRLISDLCSHIPQHRKARTIVEDVTKSIVPAGIVLLRHIFIMGGISTQLAVKTRRCAYMSPTTVAIANHIIGWLKALTNTVVRRVTPARDAALKDLRAQLNREVFVDYLEQLQKGKGGLAESEAKFEEIAEANGVEEECQEAEAAVRKEAAVHDAIVRRNRHMEAQARYATGDDQYLAFCRSTQNLGPDPLWEHRRRKMQASMNAFAAADLGYGALRQPAPVGAGPTRGTQQPVRRLDMKAPTLDEHREPSNYEKKVILEHVVQNSRFNVDAVAHELGWKPSHVKKWRDILVDRAKRAYTARGYSVSRLPEWLLH